MNRDVPARIVVKTMWTVLGLLAVLAILCTCGRRADAASPLYAYHRDDADDVTHVTVEAMRPDAPRIAPRLFSNFLEHLGGAIYEGLWANVVYNPQMEADGNGRLLRWRLNEGAEWAEDGISGRSLRLSEGSNARQLFTLPVHRQRRYRGRVWTRSLDGRPTNVEISLLRPDKPAIIARALVRADGPDWQAKTFSLTVPENAIEKAEGVELRLTALNGAAGVDMIELFPADALEDMDPDVVKAAKALRIELLRWPGGNFVSGYHWRNGIGPREKRPTMPNPAWSGLETHHFGTDEFMAFCRRTGAKPHICVNAGDGTPEEAAAWVEYCNGGPDTPMGRLRAENGHPAPYNVRVWEIGNELYGGWQIGHTDPKGNADRFVTFRKAMLRADPSIEIIATGKGDQYAGQGLEEDRRWNAAVLDAARADGRAPDYLSLHPLVSLPGGLERRYNYEEVYASAMAHPQWWSDTFAPALKQRIHERLGPGAKTRAAVTEWGIIIGGPNWLRYPNHDAQDGAVYTALFFHALFRAGDIAGLANVTALLHGGGIKKPGSVVMVDPMYHVQRMYGEARPERLMPVSVHGPGYDAPARGFLPGVKDVPWLDVLAARDRRGERLLLVVNRDRGQARRAAFRLPFALKEVRIETLTAASQQRNSPAQPEAVAPAKKVFPATGHAFSYEFPPCSVNILQLR